MKEKLLELGLSEEQAEKVLAEMETTEKAATEKMEQLQAELVAVNNQLTEANKLVKSYKDMKIEDIKTSAAAWEEKAKVMEEELQNQKEAVLDKALSGVNVYDPEVLKSLLNREALIFGEKGIEGLEEQIKELQIGKPYLFKQAEEESQYQGYRPETSTGTGTSALEQTISEIFK